MAFPIQMKTALAVLTLAAALPTAGGKAVVVDVLNAARGPSLRHGRVADMLNGKLDFALFEIDGTISDAFRDETDPAFFWLVLTGEGETFYATVNLAQCPDRDAESRLKALVGAEVTIFGLCDANADNKRPYKGYTFQFGSMADIRVRTPAPSDPFDVPETGDLSHLRPQSIPALGRRRMTGRVLAAWDGDNLLMRTPSNHIVRVELVPPLDPSPRVGDWISVTGLPETDLHRLCLKCVIWKPAPSGGSCAEPAVDTDLPRLLTNDRGETQIDTTLFGHPVRISGRVAARTGHKGRMIIRDKALTIAVEAASCPSAAALEEETLVEVTGLFVFDSSTGYRSALFPRIKSVFLVTRGPDDVRVLATPSWWTNRVRNPRQSP